MSKFVGNVGRLFFGVVAAGLFSLAFGDSDSFTDSRNGQRYRTVRIGDLTWMAENLNFQTGNSWCYGNNKSNCQKYGRLYDWNTAMTACPAGWRLPTREDWSNLVEAAGSDTVAGTRLKSRMPNWNGTDDFGFSAMPGGSCRPDGSFSLIGVSGLWWNATEYGGDRAWYRPILSGLGYVAENDFLKSYGLSVRCVQE